MVLFAQVNSGVLKDNKISFRRCASWWEENFRVYLNDFKIFSNTLFLLQ